MSFAPDRLESAIARVEALSDATAREVAREAVTAVLELHRDGVRCLLTRLRQTSANGEQILSTVAQDGIVAALLSLYGVHPQPVETRERRALVPLAQLTSKLPKKPPAGRRQGDHERCELCGEALGEQHPHLFEVERRQLTCTCDACGVLFDSNAKNLRRVPRKADCLQGFRITDAQWQALEVPVGLAFFSRSSALGTVVAAYPGPAGAIESAVQQAAWDSLVKDNPPLAALESDVSALLVDRMAARPRYYALAIDECYRLTGLVRSRWQGLTGGDAPARAVEEFFASLEHP